MSFEDQVASSPAVDEVNSPVVQLPELRNFALADEVRGAPQWDQRVFPLDHHCDARALHWRSAGSQPMWLPKDCSAKVIERDPRRWSSEFVTLQVSPQMGTGAKHDVPRTQRRRARPAGRILPRLRRRPSCTRCYCGCVQASPVYYSA
eukprot:6194649-Pleurochrysis_carterae.AAC.4